MGKKVTQNPLFIAFGGGRKKKRSRLLASPSLVRGRRFMGKEGGGIIQRERGKFVLVLAKKRGGAALWGELWTSADTIELKRNVCFLVGE